MQKSDEREWSETKELKSEKLLISRTLEPEPAEEAELRTIFTLLELELVK